MTSLISRIQGFTTALVLLALPTTAQEYEPGTTTYPAADPDGENLDPLQPAIEAENSFDAHLFNGEFFVEATDLVIKGRGFDFEWKRTYRSRANQDGPMGFNWDHSYNIHIKQDGADLILNDGELREDRFVPTNTTNVWGAPGQFRTIYLKDGGTPMDPDDDHYIVVLRHNSKWILNALDGSNTEGKIRSIIDRNGNVMLLEYAGRTGRLKTIKDTLHEDGVNERKIEIRYNLDGYISEVEDFCTDLGISGAGRKVTYSYWNGDPFGGGEDGDLKSVTSPAISGTSNGNDFLSGKTWTYEYSVGASTSVIKHNLEKVIDPKGQLVVKNVYNSAVPTGYGYDRLLRQIIGGGAGPQFNYWYSAQTPSAANNNATSLTIVNDRVGNVRELYYEDEFLALYREFSGRAPNTKALTKVATNRPISPLRSDTSGHIPDPSWPNVSSWDTLISTNDDGLITEIVYPNGRTISRCYDSDNEFARSRANLLTEQITPGVGGSSDNDTLADLTREWSHIGLFNNLAQLRDYRNMMSGFTYDGPAGVEGTLGGCPSSASSIGGSASAARGPLQVVLGQEFPKQESVEIWGFERVPKPPAGVVYSANPDSASGGDGESGGAEPGVSGGGNGLTEACPEEEMSGSALSVGCNCYTHLVNEAGQRTQTTDPEGLVTQFVYYDTVPMFGYLKNIIRDPSGENLIETFTYNSAGHVISYTDPKNQETTYEVNASGQVVRKIGPSPIDVEYVYYYDANDNPIQEDIENVESLVGSGGGVTHNVVATNPWFTTTYTYDLLNNVLSETREVDSSNAPGQEFENKITEKFEYDDNENLALVRRGEAVNGNQPLNSIAYIWDERNLLFERVIAPGSASQSTTGFDYDSTKNLVASHVGMEGVPPRRTDYLFNGYDRLKKVIDPMGNDLSLEYDEAGNVSKQLWNGEHEDNLPTALSNALLREVEYSYDERNRSEDATYSFFRYDGGPTPPNATFATEYNGVNQISATIDAETNRTDYLYDAAHRLSGVGYPHLNGTNIPYMDGNGNPVTIVDVDISSFPSTPASHSATTNLVFDELDRLVQTTDNAQNVTKFGYDSRGNRIQRIDANGVETRFEYDGLNRMTAFITDMDGDGALFSDISDIVTQQVWDDSSRLIGQTDDSGNTTRYAYDNLNRQIVRRMADGTLHQVGFGAAWGAGLSVPDLSGFQSGYDVFGNRVLTLDANGTSIACEYDDNNRLVCREVTPGTTSIKGIQLETYVYDGLGRVVKAVNEDVIVNRVYDSMDNLISEEIDIDKTPGVSGPITERVYDRVGNTTRCDYPGGRTVLTNFDDFNRKSTIVEGALVEEFHYLGRALLEARELSNQLLTSTFQFDYQTGAVRTPTAILHEETSASYLSLNSLTWDGLGNKLAKQGQLTGGIDHAYQYDDAYRLVDTTVTDVGSSATLRHTDYDLDGVHNRDSVTETILAGTPIVMNYTMSSGAPEFDSELNQYSVTPTDSRVYDENGNWIEKRDPATPTILLATIYYDAFNRMVEYQENGGNLHLYKYDCFGRRVVKIVNADSSTPEETRFFYGGRDNWHVIEEQDDQGTTLATYVYGNGVDELISMDRDVDAQSRGGKVLLLDRRAEHG